MKSVMRFFLSLFGWKYLKPPEELQSGVYILPVHTSAWDAIHAVIGSIFYNLSPITFLVENFYDLAPRFFSRLGFIRVPDMDERSSTAFVPLFRQLRKKTKVAPPPYAIAICPEGNRQYVDHYKSSFLYLSRSLKVPIYVLEIDFWNKQVQVYPSINPKGLSDKQVMDKVREYVRPETGLYPDQAGRPYLEVEND
jgi:hypothetical protein